MLKITRRIPCIFYISINLRKPAYLTDVAKISAALHAPPFCSCLFLARFTSHGNIYVPLLSVFRRLRFLLQCLLRLLRRNLFDFNFASLPLYIYIGIKVRIYSVIHFKSLLTASIAFFPALTIRVPSSENVALSLSHSTLLGRKYRRLIIR